MAFEPETRVETIILIKASGGGSHNRVLYRRARFSFVEYDGSPDRFIEPVSMSELFDVTGVAGAFNKYRGLVGGTERYDANPLSELHDFSDAGL